ncbi:MAG TPA: glycosyltransferase family 2 protein [Steroidobacteraceae bacterium]|nr:glycosyltransferase family 2 protein [Steroidobacteraceae bacterium]
MSPLARTFARAAPPPSLGAREGLELPVVAAAVVLTSLAGWTIAGAGGLLADASRVIIYVLANLVLAFDSVDLIVRMWFRRINGAAALGPSLDLALPEISHAERRVTLLPYAVVASLHNEAEHIDRFLTMLEPLKKQVWLIDDASSDSTLLRLRRVGWNCIAGGINRNKPGALKELLTCLPAEIHTIVVLDPDVRWALPAGSAITVLEEVVSDLQRSGAAALTPRVQAARGGWLEECQGLEYALACGIGRKSLRDLACNSGVSIYRRSALEDALAQHTLSIYAEDLENSVLLLASGERIYYDDRLILETQAKPSWPSLFSQRVGWSYGCAKVFAERLGLLLAIAKRSPLGAYQYLGYLGLVGIVLLPLKLVSIAILATSFLRALDDLLLLNLVPAYRWNEPLLFALWYGKSLLVLACACWAALRRGERARHLGALPFYGFYALLQYMPITIGYLNFITFKSLGVRLYEDHYHHAGGVGVLRRMAATRPSPSR